MIPFQPQLEEALARAGNTHTVEDVLAAIHEGLALPWQHKDGLIITELVRYPQHLETNCWLVAGKLADCLELLPEVEAWGRWAGARYIVGEGRKGFKRIMEPLGFRERGIRMCKELTNGQQ